MVEDARTARRALEVLDNKLLDKRNTRRGQSLGRLRTSCPDGEFEAYRAGIAAVTGPLFFLRMQPLSSEQPALIPAATATQSVAERAKLGRNKRDH